MSFPIVHTKKKRDPVTVGSLTPCKTCPFKTGVEFQYDVHTMLMNIEHCLHGAAHTCHQTDPDADWFVKSNGGIKACAGMLSMQKKAKIWPDILNHVESTTKALDIWDSIPVDDTCHTFKSFTQFAVSSMRAKGKE